MYPNANLEELLGLAKHIQSENFTGCPTDVQHAERLAELVLALDQWLVKGGFLPQRWVKDSKPQQEK